MNIYEIIHLFMLRNKIILLDQAKETDYVISYYFNKLKVFKSDYLSFSRIIINP